MVPFARYKSFLMVDELMRKAAIIKASVANIVVGIDRAACLNMLFHKGLKRLASHIGDGNRSDIPVSLDDTDDRCLPGSTSAALPLASATKVGFIDLNVAGQLAGEMVALNGLSDLGKHLPGSFVCDPNLILQLVGRNPNLEESDGTYPFGDRRPGLLKNRARGFCKLIFTASTLVFIAIFSSKLPDKLVATARAFYPVRPANLMKKLAAFVLISKIVSIVVQPHRGLLCLEGVSPSIQLVPLRG